MVELPFSSDDWVGTVDLTLRGPLGSDLRERFCVVPGLRVVTPDRVLMPRDARPAFVEVEVSPPATVSEDGAASVRLPVGGGGTELPVQVSMARTTTTLRVQLPRLQWGLRLRDAAPTSSNPPSSELTGTRSSRGTPSRSSSRRIEGVCRSPCSSGRTGRSRQRRSCSAPAQVVGGHSRCRSSARPFASKRRHRSPFGWWPPASRQPSLTSLRTLGRPTSERNRPTTTPGSRGSRSSRGAPFEIAWCASGPCNARGPDRSRCAWLMVPSRWSSCRTRRSLRASIGSRWPLTMVGRRRAGRGQDRSAPPTCSSERRAVR